MFADKTAVITGGGSGIGKALAVALAKDGANVVIADLREETANSAAEEIKAAGGKAIGVACDVSQFDAVQNVKARANEAFGVVSYLFANAGATTLERITNLTPRDFEWIIDVNILGVSNCVQTFLPDMIAQKSGHIIATSSMSGILPNWLPFSVSYATSKAGVLGMMYNLRLETEPHGIGCTTLCPGGVITNIHHAASYRPERFGEKQGSMTAPPEGFAMKHNMSAMRPPEEVAEMTLAAVRKNRAVVLSDAGYRDFYMKTLVADAIMAFDDCDAFDKAKAK